jgi:hypothetical protein
VCVCVEGGGIDDVFVCDTGNGRILQLAFPSMTPVIREGLWGGRGKRADKGEGDVSHWG